MDKTGIGLFVSILFLLGQQLMAQNVVVNLSSEKQLIRGFGGMNHTGFPGDITSAQADKAFGNGQGQIGMSILRIHIDPNSGLFSRELATAKKAKSYGAIIFASPWSPPSGMKTNNNQVGGSLKTSSYAAYAAHLKSFCDYMSNNEVPLYAISIQNEPDIKVTYESCDWTSAQMIDFLKNYASAIGSTKIIAPESFQFSRAVTDPILKDTDALSNVDIIGGHIYGGGLADYPLAREKGKEVWMTEHLVNNTDWTGALETGKEIHDCMVANFNAYVWWYIRRSYGPIDESGNVTKRGYVLSQFSKFIRPGYIRIDATASPVSNINVTAYKKDTSLVIVAVNRNTSSKDQKFTISNGTITSLTKYTTSQSKNISNDGAIEVDSNGFTVKLDAQSVTTMAGRVEPVDPTNTNWRNSDQRTVSQHTYTVGGKPGCTVYDLRGKLIRNYSDAAIASKKMCVKSGIYIIKTDASKSSKRLRIREP